VGGLGEEVSGGKRRRCGERVRGRWPRPHGLGAEVVWEGLPSGVATRAGRVVTGLTTGTVLVVTRVGSGRARVTEKARNHHQSRCDPAVHWPVLMASWWPPLHAVTEAFKFYY
jgi:hypothetical protein